MAFSSLMKPNLVASTIRRCEEGENTRFCSAMDSRPNSGRISVPARRGEEATTPARWSAASRISRSPGKNTRMSPGASRDSSWTASITPSGRRTQYRYDAAGNLIKQEDAVGTVVERTFGSAALLAKTLDDDED